MSQDGGSTLAKIEPQRVDLSPHYWESAIDSVEDANPQNYKKFRIFESTSWGDSLQKI